MARKRVRGAGQWRQPLLPGWRSNSPPCAASLTGKQGKRCAVPYGTGHGTKLIWMYWCSTNEAPCNTISLSTTAAAVGTMIDPVKNALPLALVVKVPTKMCDVELPWLPWSM